MVKSFSQQCRCSNSCVCVKSYFNHCLCRFTNFYNGGRNARSLSSLFADPERILRRFYVFAEEPCKSTITTSEPCSPVFKEAQPRPSGTHSNDNISQNQHLEFVSACVLLDCDKIKGFSVLLLDTPLTRSE